MAEHKREAWRPVVGYEGLYEVSSIGRVRSNIPSTRIADKLHKIMRQKVDDHGYLRVNLTKNKTAKAWLVSRLVAEAFIPNPNGYPMVGHNDDVKTNNTVDNLYWTTSKENNHHNGKMQRFQALHNEKIDIIASKLSCPVIGKNKETGDELFFKSMKEAERNGFKSEKISLCCSGKRQSHYGYEWRKAI